MRSPAAPASAPPTCFATTSCDRWPPLRPATGGRSVTSLVHEAIELSSLDRPTVLAFRIITMYRERVVIWTTSLAEEKACTPIITTHIVTASASPTAVHTVSDATTPTTTHGLTGQAVTEYAAAVRTVQDAVEPNAVTCALPC
jgi:hypothetical protein